MKRPGIAVLLLLLLAISSACAQQDARNPVGPRIPLTVGNTVFNIELARTDQERQMGLMFRSSMAESDGMLFIFDNEEHLAFWMKNTNIPLSIAYISAAGEIREIYDMSPHSLRSIEGQYFAKYALELNQGAFARAGIKVGDYIRLSDLPSAK